MAIASKFRKKSILPEEPAQPYDVNTPDSGLNKPEVSLSEAFKFDPNRITPAFQPEGSGLSGAGSTLEQGYGAPVQAPVEMAPTVQGPSGVPVPQAVPASAPTAPVKPDNSAYFESKAKAAKEMKVRDEDTIAQIGLSVAAGSYETLGSFGSAAEFVTGGNVGKDLADWGEQKSKSIEDRRQTPTDKFGLGDSQFWIREVPKVIPSAVSLIIPGLAAGAGSAKLASIVGMGARSEKVAGILGGAFGSRFVEASMEAGGTYRQLLKEGKPEKTAMEEAEGVFNKNMTLVGMDAGEIALVLMPSKVWKFMEKAGSRVARGVASAGMEGAEELVQGYFQHVAEANANNTTPLSIFDYAQTDEAKKAFAIGAAGGAMFAVGGNVAAPFWKTGKSTEETRQEEIKLLPAPSPEAVQKASEILDSYSQKLSEDPQYAEKAATVVSSMWGNGDAIRASAQTFEEAVGMTPQRKAEQVAANMERSFSKISDIYGVPLETVKENFGKFQEAPEKFGQWLQSLSERSGDGFTRLGDTKGMKNLEERANQEYESRMDAESRKEADDYMKENFGEHGEKRSEAHQAAAEIAKYQVANGLEDLDYRAFLGETHGRTKSVVRNGRKAVERVQSKTPERIRKLARKIEDLDGLDAYESVMDNLLNDSEAYSKAKKSENRSRMEAANAARKNRAEANRMERDAAKKPEGKLKDEKAKETMPKEYSHEVPKDAPFRRKSESTPRFQRDVESRYGSNAGDSKDTTAKEQSSIYRKLTGGNTMTAPGIKTPEGGEASGAYVRRGRVNGKQVTDTAVFSERGVTKNTAWHEATHRAIDVIKSESPKFYEKVQKEALDRWEMASSDPKSNDFWEEFVAEEAFYFAENGKMKTEGLSGSIKAFILDVLAKIKEFLFERRVNPLNQFYRNLRNAKYVRQALPGYPMGASFKEIVPAETFEGFDDITTKVLDQLVGRSSVKFEFIQNLSKQQGIKKQEIEVVTKALESWKPGEQVDVKEFADRVYDRLLHIELELLSESDRETKWDSYTLPERFFDQNNWNSDGYFEIVHTVPFETGRSHYADYDNYFGHTRFHDVEIDGRRTMLVNETQNDIMQMGSDGQKKYVKTLNEAGGDYAWTAKKYGGWADSNEKAAESLRKFAESIDVGASLEDNLAKHGITDFKNEWRNSHYAFEIPHGDAPKIADKIGLNEIHYADGSKFSGSQLVSRFLSNYAVKKENLSEFFRKSVMDVVDVIESNAKSLRKKSEYLSSDSAKNRDEVLIQHDAIWVERQVRDIVKYAVDNGYESIMFPNGRTLAFVERWVGSENSGISESVTAGERTELYGEEYVVLEDAEGRDSVRAIRSDQIANEFYWERALEEEKEFRREDVRYDIQNADYESLGKFLREFSEQHPDEVLEAINERNDGKFETLEDAIDSYHGAHGHNVYTLSDIIESSDIEGWDDAKESFADEYEDENLESINDAKDYVVYLNDMQGEGMYATDGTTIYSSDGRMNVEDLPVGGDADSDRELTRDQIMGEMSDDQKGTMYFYDRILPNYLKKYRKDTVDVTDDSGLEWYRIDFDEAKDKPNTPQTAFKRIGSDAIKKDAKRLKDDVIESVYDFWGRALSPLSARLRNISQGALRVLREFEFNILNSEIMWDMRKHYVPFGEKISELGEDTEALDLALKNRDRAETERILEKHGLLKEWNEVRNSLDSLFKQANEVGMDIDYLDQYFPRIVKDSRKLLNALRKKLGEEEWSVVREAIRRAEEAHGPQSEEDRAHIADMLIRGFKQYNVTLTPPGNVKARGIDRVGKNINDYYEPSHIALSRYVSAMNENIEARKLFGKGPDLDASVGTFVIRQMAEGKMTPEQEQEFTDVIRARLNARGMGSLGAIRDLGYLTAMNSPMSAITQIGDLAFAFYQGAMPENLKIKREDLGIDGIQHELSEGTSKYVNKLFRAIGLEAMDKFGKTALINASYAKIKKQVKNGDFRSVGYLTPEEREKLRSDMLEGRQSSLVRFVLFNELSEFQPITQTEMPEFYNQGGNLRILYALKTYSIKQIDIFRREAYEKIRDGRKNGDPAMVTEGVKNLIMLATLIMLANGTADMLKNVILGRPIKMSDLLVDNLARLFGMSKFITYKVKEEGIMSGIARLITPAAPWLEYPVKDVFSAGDGKGLESVQLIPIVGKELYWWIGRGRSKVLKEKYGIQ